MERKTLPMGRPRGSRRPVRPSAMVNARLRAGLTGQEVARLIHGRRKVAVTTSALYAYERGDSTPPEWLVESLAVLYGVDSEALFERNLSA